MDIENIGKPRPALARPKSMPNPKKLGGFKYYARQNISYRDPMERIADFEEIREITPDITLKTQTARCMNCGVPFCHEPVNGCPLSNKYVF